MVGSTMSILLIFVKSVFGIWLISVTLMGYVIQPINIVKRALFGIAGVGMFLPDTIFNAGIPLAIIGLLIAIGTIGYEFINSRKLLDTKSSN